MRAFALVAVAVSVGCASPGDLAFSSELIDFGLALPGVERTLSVELTNRGGSKVVLTDARSNNSAFALSFLPRTAFAPGEIRLMSVHYTPAAGATEPEEATIEVSTEEGVSATLRVTGTPTSPDCTLTDVLDFGAVGLGETVTLPLALQNSTRWPGTAFVGPLEQVQAPVFTATSGSFELAAGGQTTASFSVTPTEAREFSATVRMNRHQLCEQTPVRLKGIGVAQTLSWTPATADFGSVQIGTTGRVQVTFHNMMFRPMVLTQLEAREGASSSPLFGAPTSLTVPPARRDEMGSIIQGDASIELTFDPLAAGPRAGQLTARTDLIGQPAISVNLRGAGTQ